MTNVAGEDRPQRVQDLHNSGISTLPSHYVQPLETRPDPARRAGLTSAVPIIDLRRPSEDLAAEIDRACREWGAYQVVGHGVPAELLRRMRGAGMAFFGSPLEERLRYACDAGVPASEGYGSRMLAKEDGVLDWRDYFDHHTLPESRRNPANWPISPPHYRQTVTEYSNQMKTLAQKLLRLVSISLSFPPPYIEEAVGEVYQNITISYYPPCPQPDLALGLQSHSDMGALTLLIQDEVGGLELLKDGEWVLVQPLPDAIVVLLGDQTEIISNGEYHSCIHRALVNANQPRLSVATFYDPAKTRKISPSTELVTRCSGRKFRDVIYGDYVSAWYSKGPDGKRNIDALRL